MAAANPLDNAINQHLQSLKASQSLVTARPPPPNHAPPVAASWTAPGPGAGMPLPPQPALPPLAAAPAPGGAAPAAAPSLATLSVAIDNLTFRYQLAEADLRETFQRWGTLQSVQINRDGVREVGVVQFADRVDATDAQRQLHGHSFPVDGSTGTLAVVVGGPEQLSPPLLRPPPSFMPGQTVPQSGSGPAGPLGGPAVRPADGQAPGALQPGPPPAGLPGLPPMPAMPGTGPQPMGTMPPMQMGGLPGLPPLVPQPAGAMPKSAPPALGGPASGPAVGLQHGKGDGLAPAGKGEANGNGAMMGKMGKGGWPSADSWSGEGTNGSAPRPAWTCKILLHAETLHPEFPLHSKVVGQGGQNVEHIGSQTKCVVQMRGKGSGTLEPETGRELPEPLFVWLTSDTASSGKNAVELFQDLLKYVYEEHQAFVTQRGATAPPTLEAVVLEGVEPPRAGPPAGPPPGPCLGPPGLPPGFTAPAVGGLPTGPAPGLGPGMPPFTAPGTGGPGFMPTGPLPGPASYPAPGLPGAPLAGAPGLGGPLPPGPGPMPGDFYRQVQRPGPY